MRKTILLVCFLLISFLSSSQPIIWDGKSEFINIGQQVSFLEDPVGKLTIEQVSSESFADRFIKSEKIILNFGFSESVRWLKFSVNNTTSQSLWLEVAQPFLPVTDMYFRDQTGQWQVSKAGYKANLNRKQIKHFFQVFPLPKSNEPIYIRFISYAQPLPIKIWHDQAFQVKVNKQVIFYGVYVGVLFFVIINNLFLFFSLRRFTYLHYSFLVFMYILIAACVMDGFILYLFPETDLLYWYLLIPIINVANAVWFGILFLEVKKYAPTLYRFSLIILIYCISYLIWYRYLPLMVVIPLNQAHALLNLASVLVLGIQTGRKGNRIGYYYALSYSVFCLLIFVEAVYIQTGNPPYIFEISHVSFALLLEVLFLAYILSKRFEWERYDTEKSKTEAQQLLLEKTRENELLLLSQNETLEREVAERTNAIVQKSSELQQSLDTLKATQNQLVQKEKMASLGELTAGIAHEIQNPLNFVNNFAEVSVELADELEESVQAGDTAAASTLSADLRQNMKHIVRNGQRASAIVRSMLEHSRSGTDERQPTDVNALAGEYLKLAYHGMRAKDSNFNAQLVTEFDPELGKMDLSAQEIGRVLLNLYNNAFYAVQQKQAQQSNGYKPMVSVSTHRQGNTVELQVKDNGMGIPESIRQKIFQPFFTTKPAGQGTGLGLSLSYDIVTKGYGGEMTVVSQEGEGTAFVVQLPVHESDKRVNLSD